MIQPRDEIPGSTCPTCDAAIEPPRDDADSLETGVSCPACGRPLTWFFDERVGGRWIVDEGAEGRRRMEEGPGDVDSPVAT